MFSRRTNCIHVEEQGALILEISPDPICAGIQPQHVAALVERVGRDRAAGDILSGGTNAVALKFCRVIGIESDGWVKGCLGLPSRQDGRDDFLEGNIRQRSLEDIWHDADAFSYNRKFQMSMLNGFCAQCEYARICRGGCRWTVSTAGRGFDNPYCHYRVIKEQQARLRKASSTGLKAASAFLAAALAAAGCKKGSQVELFADSGIHDAGEDAAMKYDAGDENACTMDYSDPDASGSDAGCKADCSADCATDCDTDCTTDCSYDCQMDYCDYCPDDPTSSSFY